MINRQLIYGKLKEKKSLEIPVTILCLCFKLVHL